MKPWIPIPGGGGGMSARFPMSQRNTAYQPRATLWVGHAPDSRVLKERRISSHHPPAPELCGAPSERGNGWIPIPRALPWAGMRCPFGALGIRGSCSGGNQVRLQRLVFSELAHSHDAEADHLTLRVHSLHDGIVVGFLFVASGFREADFQEIRLSIEPDLLVYRP